MMQSLSVAMEFGPIWNDAVAQRRDADRANVADGNHGQNSGPCVLGACAVVSEDRGGDHRAEHDMQWMSEFKQIRRAVGGKKLRRPEPKKNYPGNADESPEQRKRPVMPKLL